MPRARKLEDRIDRKTKKKVIRWKSMEKIFVGLDVHKKTIQMSVMDKDGEELLNKSIPNTPNSIYVPC